MVALLVLSILAGAGLLVLYSLGGQTQLEGALLFVLLGGIGFSLILWGKYLFPPEIVTEPRGEHESPEAERLEAERAYLEGEQQIGRRSLLVRMMIGAFGALGLAAIFPIRSLGPSPGRSLFETAWTRGTRLVDANNVPIRIDDLDVGGVVTVFPEGFTDRAWTRSRSWCASRPRSSPCRRAATATRPRATSATPSSARMPDARWASTWPSCTSCSARATSPRSTS